MAVNRYDQAYVAPYVEQYTPIPFDALLRIGQQYAQDRDKTEAAFQTALTQYRNFNSPSAVDTQRWYDLTVAPATQLANEMASNPELLRSPEGRRRIQNFINTRPYAELSQLERSRDQMLQRQKNIAELIKDGTYNEAWHNMNLSNYDTLRNGIFSDINVTPYKDAASLVKPYIDGVKDSYIGTEGGFDYYGVTPQQIQQIVGGNLSSLMTTPQATEYIRQYVRQGYSPEEAQQLFANQLITSASKFARQNRKTNPFATLQYQDQLIRSRWRDPNNPANKDKDPNNPNNPWYLTNLIQMQGQDKYNLGRAQVLSRMPEYREAVRLLNSDDEKQQQAGKNIIEQIASENPTYTHVFRKVFDQYGNVDKAGNTVLSRDALRKGTNDILNNFSNTISGSYGNLLLNTIPGISQELQNTPLGRRRTISSGANLDLATRTVAALAGFNPSDGSTSAGRNRFLNELKGGGFNNMIVLGNERILTVPTVNAHGEPTTANYQTIRVAISADEAKQRGLTDEDMKDAGAIKYNAASKSTSTTLSGDYDNDDEEITYNKISSNTSSSKNNDYWLVDLTSEIPIEGLGAEYANQQALKQNVNPTTYSALYQDVQDQAYGLSLMNEE